MVKYDFSVLAETPLKGHKLDKAKDYETKVQVEKDGKILYDGVVKVRKNIGGVFPDMDSVKKLSPSLQKELCKNLKAYIKKAK